MKHMKLKAQGDLRIHFRLPSAMKGWIIGLEDSSDRVGVRWYDWIFRAMTTSSHGPLVGVFMREAILSKRSKQFSAPIMNWALPVHWNWPLESRPKSKFIRILPHDSLGLQRPVARRPKLGSLHTTRKMRLSQQCAFLAQNHTIWYSSCGFAKDLSEPAANLATNLDCTSGGIHHACLWDSALQFCIWDSYMYKSVKIGPKCRQIEDFQNRIKSFLEKWDEWDNKRPFWQISHAMNAISTIAIVTAQKRSLSNHRRSRESGSFH
jgi:hypothetical protein